MASTFMLSMLSPVWRAKLCGDVGNAGARQLDMVEEDATIFWKAVALGCGESIAVERGLEELMTLARVADVYRMEVLQGDLEEALMNRLVMESCGPILKLSHGSGLVRLERASRKLALREFDQFAESAGYLDIDEDVLGSLLEDDGLVSESEERVLTGVVRWMKGGSGAGVRGEGLLRKIRFPFMSGEFLTDEARKMLPESGELEFLVREAGLLKGVAPELWIGRALEYLDAKVLVPRRGRGVKWEGYAGGGETRIPAGKLVHSVCVHGGGLVCAGRDDGSIRVWNRATLEEKLILRGHTDAVMALVSVGGRLISGSDGKKIGVWDMATGGNERMLVGHSGGVTSLAVSGNRLVSGSTDETVRVWRMDGPVSSWRCEHKLTGHKGTVWCLATWGGMAASGSGDGTIRVWDVGAGSHEQTLAVEAGSHALTLAGQDGAIVALVACGQRLISSSGDKTVRVWSMTTWECVQKVQAFAEDSFQFVSSLAVSGSSLVGGSVIVLPFGTERYVRVWDIETLELLHTLKQPAGQNVYCLASDGAQVWGAVGDSIVVWGRCG